MTDNIPLGLSFSYLKGSLMWMHGLLAEDSREVVYLQSVILARIQLVEALDKYDHSLHHDKETNTIVRKTLVPLGAILVTDSHYMLQTASSLLSFSLKLLSEEPELVAKKLGL